MNRKSICLVIALAYSLVAAGQLKKVPYVILVSFDGFRHDYVNKVDCPSFKKLKEKGAYAEGLIPAFPSKTFPNHYTIATGLYPGHHGLVDNAFYDPVRKEKFNRKDSTGVDPYYYGGTPLWTLAQQQGIKVAPYFWVGSEVPFNGHYPEYYFPYNESFPNQSRVNQVMEWLTLPEKERPHLITLYFSFLDAAGHDYGPESEEVKHEIKEADRLLGSLLNRLDTIGFPVNVIVLSDHGMKELVYSEETYIYLNEILDLHDSSLVIVNSGTNAHLYIKDKNKIEFWYQKIKKKENHFKVYKASQFPASWHYNHKRSGDIILLADFGCEITVKSKTELVDKIMPGKTWGAHGYDPDTLHDMHGIFFAAGPNIKEGVRIPPFKNIHIYPFIAKILGLDIPPVDGSFKVLQGIYKP